MVKKFTFPKTYKGIEVSYDNGQFKNSLLQHLYEITLKPRNNL